MKKNKFWSAAGKFLSCIFLVLVVYWIYRWAAVEFSRDNPTGDRVLTNVHQSAEGNISLANYDMNANKKLTAIYGMIYLDSASRSDFSKAVLERDTAKIRSMAEKDAVYQSFLQKTLGKSNKNESNENSNDVSDKKNQNRLNEKPEKKPIGYREVIDFSNVKKNRADAYLYSGQRIKLTPSAPCKVGNKHPLTLEADVADTFTINDGTEGRLEVERISRKGNVILEIIK